MIISVATSVFIEITQFVFSIGVADVDDIILNTTGAAIGLLILKMLIKINTTHQRSAIGKKTYSENI
jgi:glycopeptide antibiotics resistance protein